MTAAFVLLLCVLVYWVLFSLAKKTAFRFSMTNGYLWPLVMYRDVLLVFLPLVLIQIYGVEAFPLALRSTSDADTLGISLFTIYSIFAFACSLGVSARLFALPFREIDVAALADHSSLKRFAFSALALGLGLLFFSYLILGYKHALIASLLTTDNLLSIRLANVYASSLPTQIAYLLPLTSWVLSIHSGLLFFKKQRWLGSAFLGAAIFLASANGGKAPIVTSALFSLISYFSFIGVKISPITWLVKFPIFLTILFFSIYFIVTLQIKDLEFDEFLFYLVERLGVGQMSGVFDTFSIAPLEGSYFYHMIPFASLFVDYPIYAKDLMLFVENSEFDATGVKNSLFISEAFGIGGWWLAVTSPFLVGFSYAAGLALLYRFLRLTFGVAVASLYSIPIYLISSPLTGGFASFPLFKGLLLTVISLGFIFFIFQISKFSFGRRAG